MSELKKLLEKHRNEIEHLRDTCKHDKKYIKIKKDYGCVGCGTAFPSINVICTNCGTKKIMFLSRDEQYIKPKKVLTIQRGIRDQRLNGYVRHDWELE